MLCDYKFKEKNDILIICLLEGIRFGGQHVKPKSRPLNIFFTPFENNEVVILDMFLQDLTLLYIYQYHINICFHRKLHVIMVSLITNLALLTMKLDCDKD